MLIGWSDGHKSNMSFTRESEFVSFLAKYEGLIRSWLSVNDAHDQIKENAQL